MAKDILPNLKIKIPSSTNPVPFFNNTGLDTVFSKEVSKLFKEREITFGMLPEMEEKRKVYEEIVRRFGSINGVNLQFALFDRFNLFDPPGTKPSKWMLTPLKSVIQPENVEAKKKGSYQNTGSLLTSKATIESGITALSATLRPGSTGETGMVFNFKHYQDFWVASYRNDEQNKIKNAFIIKRVLYGHVAEYGKGVLIPTDFTNLTIVISVRKNEGGSRANIALENSSESIGVDLRNIEIEANTAIGFYSQNSIDAEYFTLRSESNSKSMVFFPIETDIDRLVNERYERIFNVYNIDLRPNNWLSLFKRLWAEKYFAKRKLENIQKIYSALFETGPDKTPPSPEDIDNTEGRVKQSFEDYLRAENKYQEFSSFMSSAGASVPEEPQHDDFLSVFNNTTIAGKIEQQIQRNAFVTWKEFFITKAILKPGSNMSSLITKAKRLEVINTEGEEAWGMYVRSIIKPYVAWDTIEKVPHYRFVLENIGDTSETEDGTCIISHKFWKTNHTSSKEDFKIEISNPNKVTEKINEIIEGGSSDNQSVKKETDMREYRNQNGEYVDQYGISLQDHVIALTERQDASVSNILVIPSFESDQSLSPDSILIVKDPIFSGKQLHSPSIQFFEKFVMDIQWDGIGLGEFSHSVNLFPGEERELKIVTSKKRSWETVSKSKSSSKATSASESAQASKRNDSFASKVSDSLDTSSSFSRSASSSTSFGANVSASGGFGFFSASASANYSSQSSEQSNSNLSSVAKRASEVASQSGAEVSQNNKVSFSSSTETEQSFESKVAGEDMETESSTIKIYNINEGRTANYNFFQVTNIYNTLIKIEDCSININTGVEIIPGTGITISKRFELEDFTQITKAFPLYSTKEKKDIFKIIAAQIIVRYVRLTGDSHDDNPQILVPDRLVDQKKLKTLRASCLKVLESDVDDEVIPNSSRKKVTSLADRLPEELMDLKKIKFKIEGFDLTTKNTYTINSGKYYVESLLGVIPATEEYLEERRKIETEKQRADVEEIRARIKDGVYPQAWPEKLTSLSIGENTNNKVQ